MNTDKSYDIFKFGYINNDWRTESRVITILRLGSGENYFLEEDILLYIKLGPNYLSILPEIYDSCMGQIDKGLLRLESSKSNWEERLDPLLLTQDKEFILKNYNKQVKMFNEACRNFGSEEENEVLFKQLFIASCFVRDLLKDDKQELIRVFDSSPFFYRCFPFKYRFLLKTEMKYFQNLKIEKRRMGNWEVQVPLIEPNRRKGNQLQEDLKGNQLQEDLKGNQLQEYSQENSHRNLRISKEECEKKTINNTGKFYFKDIENANLNLENFKNQALQEMPDVHFENNASSTMKLSFFVILFGVFLSFISFRNFDSSKKCFFLILFSMAFLGIKMFPLEF